MCDVHGLHVTNLPRARLRRNNFHLDFSFEETRYDKYTNYLLAQTQSHVYSLCRQTNQKIMKPIDAASEKYECAQSPFLDDKIYVTRKSVLGNTVCIISNLNNPQIISQFSITIYYKMLQINDECIRAVNAHFSVPPTLFASHWHRYTHPVYLVCNPTSLALAAASLILLENTPLSRSPHHTCPQPIPIQNRAALQRRGDPRGICMREKKKTAAAPGVALM